MKELLHFFSFITALAAVWISIVSVQEIRAEKQAIESARLENNIFKMGRNVAKACIIGHARGYTLAGLVMAHFVFVVIQRIYSVLNP